MTARFIATTGALALAIGLSSVAQATVIDLNELRNSKNDTYYVYGPYTEPTGAYKLTSSNCLGTRPTCFTSTPTSGLGSLDRVGAALTNYGGGAMVSLSRVDGAAFLLDTIDFAPLYNNFSGYGSSTLDILFSFKLADGSSSSKTLTIANTAGQRLTTTTLDFSSYGSLLSLGWTAKAGSSGFVQFDNINVAAVPEPQSWALMMLGFGMLGGALRQSRRKTALTFA